MLLFPPHLHLHQPFLLPYLRESLGEQDEVVGRGEQLEETHQAAAPRLVDAVVDQRALLQGAAGTVWLLCSGNT